MQFHRPPPNRGRFATGVNILNNHTGQLAFQRKSNSQRTLDEIRADILALEKETEGLLSDIISTG